MIPTINDLNPQNLGTYYVMTRQCQSQDLINGRLSTYFSQNFLYLSDFTTIFRDGVD